MRPTRDGSDTCVAFAGDHRSSRHRRPSAPILQAYGLCCIAITADRAVHLTRDVGRLRPLPVIAAWWAPAATCVAIKQLLDRQGSCDVLAAAASLRTFIAPHDEVIAEARNAVARIDRSLEQAKAVGLLRCFNRAYSIERRKARTQGKPFLVYAQAYTRFKRLIYTAAPGALKADDKSLKRALDLVSK